MKTLPKMEISDELDAQINEGIRVSELCKADVIRQALRIGLRSSPPISTSLHCGWRSGYARLLLNQPN
jgi:hypothetical protein